MDDETIVVCWPAELVPFPTPGSRKERCMSCLRSVWRSDSTPLEAVAWCWPCALSDKPESGWVVQVSDEQIELARRQGMTDDEIEDLRAMYEGTLREAWGEPL